MNRTKSAWTAHLAAAALAAGLLGGCAMSDDKAASLLVAPGDYDLYSCPQLAQTAADLRKKRGDLEALMARAEGDSGGRFMSAVGYRPEYLKVRGEVHEVETTAAAKHCDLSSLPAPQQSSVPPVPSAGTPGLVPSR